MHKKAGWLFLIGLVLLASPGSAADEVKIGVTSVQPPFVIDVREQDGLAYDLIDAMNAAQDDFRFVPKWYPAKRLLANYGQKIVDIVAFNDLRWGWAERGGTGSLHLTEGADIFFELKVPAQKSSAGLALGAVRGFHYRFAGFDSEKLSQMSHVSLVNNENSVLRLVEYGRVSRGISSRAFLNWVSVHDPERFHKIRLLPEPDHTYNRQLVVLEHSPVQVGQINVILRALVQSGQIADLYKRYGLGIPDALAAREVTLSGVPD